MLLDNNDLSTIAFQGGVTLSTGANAAFTATNGGTVTVTGSANTLATTTGTALNISNTSIGAADVTFRSISSSGGSATGIILNTTGSAGGLTVAGTGTPGSGGTIANKTGSDGSTTTGIGIYLNSTSDVNLSWMQLNDFHNFAIFGSSVTNFSLANSVLNGTNGDNDGFDEGVISFGKTNPGGLNGLLGTNSITDTVIEGGREHNVQVYNQSGTFSLTITRVTNRNNSVAAGSDGILAEMQGPVTATIVVDGCDFISLKSQAMQVAANLNGCR